MCNLQGGETPSGLRMQAGEPVRTTSPPRSRSSRGDCPPRAQNAAAGTLASLRWMRRPPAFVAAAHRRLFAARQGGGGVGCWSMVLGLGFDEHARRGGRGAVNRKARTARREPRGGERKARTARRRTQGANCEAQLRGARTARRRTAGARREAANRRARGARSQPRAANREAANREPPQARGANRGARSRAVVGGDVEVGGAARSQQSDPDLIPLPGTRRIRFTEEGIA